MRYRSTLAILTGVAVCAALAWAWSTPAAATEDATVACDGVTGWYVNPDETDRKPKPTEAGFEFDGTDLIHHGTDLALADLEPGTYVATPDPDQPSFFSVEVHGVSGAYGTLRWDDGAGKWSITIGAGTAPDGTAATAGQHTDVSPEALLAGKVTKWGAFDPDTDKVISFGVGYTQNPPGTVTTTVSSVTFNGTTHNLKCQPEQTEPSPTPTAVPTTPAATSRPPELALTGNEPTKPLALGGVLLLAGISAIAGLAWWQRRRDRRTEFRAD